MKTRSVKVIILLLFCYTCLSIENSRVYFVSRNFNNTLHWDPGRPAFPGENVTYSVEYKSDTGDQQYKNKEGCQNIAALSCDLTINTPSVHDVHYMARVWVNGRIHGVTKTRLRPIAHTILGPPILSTEATVSSLCVNVTLPLGPYGVSVGDNITGSKSVESKIIYILRITHPEWAAQAHTNTTGSFVINLKNNGTEYCGHVVYKPSAEYGRLESENSSFCVTLPGNSLMLLPWLLVTAALLAGIVVTAAVCMCNYVKGGKEKSMPEKLFETRSTHPAVLHSLDKDLNISKPVLCPQSDRTVYATIRVKPNAPPVAVGGYTPQDLPCQAWLDASGSSVGTGAHSRALGEEDTSGQSSEIYSVVAVHACGATPEDTGTGALPSPPSGKSWDKGSPKPTSGGVPPLQDPEPCDADPARPLLLHAVRDADGRLSLPSLSLQLQSGTGDPQGKPLLSDLIDSQREGPSLATLQSLDGSEWSDSGCDDVNTPNGIYSPRFQPESGYKQNWMPAIFIESESKDGCEYTRTNYPLTWAGQRKEEEQEEEEEDGGEEGQRQILLGDWVLQIQE